MSPLVMVLRLNMLVKNGCICEAEPKGTIFKLSRHPFIIDGVSFNRYEGRANDRDFINGAPCVKFNKGVSLDVLMNKGSFIPKSKATFSSEIKTNEQ